MRTKLAYLFPLVIFLYGLICGVFMQKIYVGDREFEFIVTGGIAVIIGFILMDIGYLIYRVIRFVENDQAPEDYPFDSRFKIMSVLLGVLVLSSIFWQIKDAWVI